MSLPEVDNLLRQKTGIDAKIIGYRKIAKAVETRMLACGIIKLDNYVQILRVSSEELDKLIELLIIPETWFFRDHAPFEFLAHYIHSRNFHKLGCHQLRLLSVPCSTGEEPYSLSMKFLDMGVLPEQFQIDAVDISKQSLEKAKKGIYTRNSFRGDYLKFQSRYFIQRGTEYHLSAQVKNTVNFSYGNLLDPNFLSERKPYDVIFCRNVLIYFDNISKNLTIKKLYSLLKEEGILSVGSAETRLLANCGIDLIRHNFGFIGCKKMKTAAVERNDIISSIENSQLIGKMMNITAPDKKQLNPLFSSHEQVLTKSILPIDKSANNIEIKVTEPEKNDLETIRNLADRGNLAEAISLCNQYLQYDSASVEAHVLLGQIYQAQGWEIKAEKYFQKAVYLDPKNYQALLHLLLLKEQIGELAKADILRQRIRRLEK